MLSYLVTDNYSSIFVSEHPSHEIQKSVLGLKRNHAYDHNCLSAHTYIHTDITWWLFGWEHRVTESNYWECWNYISVSSPWIFRSTTLPIPVIFINKSMNHIFSLYNVLSKSHHLILWIKDAASCHTSWSIKITFMLQTINPFSDSLWTTQPAQHRQLQQNWDNSQQHLLSLRDQ